MHNKFFIISKKNIIKSINSYFSSIGMQKVNKGFSNSFYKRINIGYILVARIVSEPYLYISPDLSYTKRDGRYIFDIEFDIVRDFYNSFFFEIEPELSLRRLINNDENFILNEENQLIDNITTTFYDLLFKPLYIDKVNLYDFYKNKMLPFYPEYEVHIWDLLFVMALDYNYLDEAKIWQDNVESLEAWKGETLESMKLKPTPGSVPIQTLNNNII